MRYEISSYIFLLSSVSRSSQCLPSLSLNHWSNLVVMNGLTYRVIKINQQIFTYNAYFPDKCQNQSCL